MGKKLEQPWPELATARHKRDRYSIISWIGLVLAAVLFITLPWDIPGVVVLATTIAWPQARMIHHNAVARTLRKHRTAIRAYEQLHGDGV